jgi:hypothetical protein
MKLLDALKAIRPLLKETLANYSGLVACSNGTLRAYDGQVSIKVKADGWEHASWAVDGAKLLSVLAPDSAVSLSTDNLVVKNGRAIYRLKLLHQDEVPDLQHEGATFPVRPDDWNVLLRASQFRSPHAVYPWASCIYVRNNRAYVTNNIAACVFTLGMKGEGAIPSMAVETFGGKNPPNHMHLDDRCAVFVRDELSLRCAIPDASPPEVFFDRLDALALATAPVVEGLADAIKAAVTIDGRTVVIDGTGVRAMSQTGDAVEVPVATGTDKEVTFDPRFLLPVISISDKIDWEAYPSPVLFSGAGVRGILAGRR